LKVFALSSFDQFSLNNSLLKALHQEGYTTPTPIQQQAIPHVLKGADLLGIAQTGTGKTAAFALPTLHRLAHDPSKMPPRRGCRALILSPTRELASQIADSFKAYGRHLRLSVATVFGGVPIGKQERQLINGVDVLVATPGRLLDLIDRRAMGLRDVEILVLDEADQMMDLGFIHALRRIVTLLPSERQTLFFSATMPKAIASLADDFLRDPVHVSVAPISTTAERVDQSVMFVDSGQKQALLEVVLKDPKVERVLVFTRTKHGADRVVRSLDEANIHAAAIHGNKSQAQRERALASFKSGRCRVLVATDIAARGIDVDGVTHVINYELPNVPEQYVHRIGRTARAGAAGIALSFCNGEERAYLRDIERLTRLKVEVLPLPEGIRAPQEREFKPAPKPQKKSAHRGQGGRPQFGANPFRQGGSEQSGRSPSGEGAGGGSREGASGGAGGGDNQKRFAGKPRRRFGANGKVAPAGGGHHQANAPSGERGARTERSNKDRARSPRQAN
jgi:ATP-dependent RNA helicase RhlE